MKPHAPLHGTITRRDVMRAASSATLLSATSFVGLRQALAQVHESGKPLLNASRLNSLFAKNRALLNEFAADPRRFLSTSFSLTPAQQKRLAAFTDAEAAQVQSAVRYALGHNLPVVTFCARQDAKIGETILAETPQLTIIASGQVTAAAGVAPALGSPAASAVKIGAAL